MLTAMDYLPSDLEHMNTNFLDMIENEVNSQQILDIENLNSDKLNDLLNGDLLQENGCMDFDDDTNNANWLQNLQWGDSTKVPQSLIDASNEVENNNPNLLVNPQSVLPIHSAPIVPKNNNQQLNQINTFNGIPVKINGQDAVLTPTHHPQIQYVTVQNVVSLNNQQIGYTVQPITICQQQNLQSIGTVTSPSLSSPVLVEHLQNGIHTQQHINNNNNKIPVRQKPPEKVYPKPVYSYSCLIAMALKNSKTGNLPVSEIYNFMIDNFPYFKTAPDGWKNSVRHNLSLNKCFAKAHDGKANGTHTRKGCLWALNPAKIEKMEEEIVKWRKKDPESVKLSMSKPENLELIEQGKAGPPREADEPSSPVKQTPATPVKQQVTVRAPVVHQRIQPQPQQIFCSRDVAVMVKTEPEINVIDVNPYDSPMTDLNMQSGIWDNELTIGVGNPTQLSNNGCSSPLVSPTQTGPTMYHGNITYTCSSPQLTNSPVHSGTPTKLYQQTPTKIYPQTPSKLVLA